ncbi:MAG: efflux RND transporter periplasmic adaptor subunit [Acidobacteriota bacterium]|nr:efflux RND transporter periplasmic adaptor subunit [Acidobacteriota bacterium]
MSPRIFGRGSRWRKLRIDARLAARRLELAEQAVALQEKSRRLRLATAERKVKELEQAVTRIREDLKRLEVGAERAGYVVLVPNWRGDKPKVGETVWRGRPILELADLTHMQVAAEVAEADAGYVAEGQRVEIRLDAAPDRLFSGRIRRLGRLFRTKSKDIPSKVFDAIIEIDDPDTELMRPGMAASLKILVPTPGPVIQVSEQAVRHTDDGAWVEVRRGGARRSEKVRVRLGARWQGKVVVDSGLEPGDLVKVRDDQG